MNTDTAIQCQSISKKYDKIEALKDISFETKKGEIFGIIGPDGAGKTTLFRILTTLILAENGTATVDGFDVVRSIENVKTNGRYGGDKPISDVKINSIKIEE